MFQKIITFWNAFWNALKTAYNKAFKNVPKDGGQEYRDITKINFLAIFVSKLNNLSNTDSNFDIVSDSALAEPLKKLCADIETKRFEISSEMLGNGDFWVFPAHTKGGQLFHRYVTQENVRILEMDGENITSLAGIIDEYVDKENKTYLLNRKHTLENRNLTIETYTTNERNERVYLEQWAEDDGTVYVLENANHIGVGRFKSPASSRGLSAVYGVPLNYGCTDIENRVFNDLKMIEKEFKNGESKIFADPLILKKSKNLKGEDGWDIPENIYPIDTRSGQVGVNMEIFAPGYRYEGALKSKLLDDMQQLEQQIGTDRGFLTPFEGGSAATATEIRRANASTIALIGKIHDAISAGVEMTLEADAVFLNIPRDLWSLKIDWFDPFEDTDKQYERIANGVDRGTAEKIDETQWLFPNLTPEECAEKIERIKAEKTVDVENRLNDLVGGA